MALRVLLVEDSEDDALLLERELRRHGYAPSLRRVDDAAGLAHALEDSGWDVVITDHNLPGFSSEVALQMIRQSEPDTPVIILSGTIGEEAAVAAMKAGAADYIMKSNMARLVPAIERELRDAEVRRKHRQAEATIRHLAYHDALTGLTNRHRFERRLADALADACETDAHHALLYLDLDQFKVVNDTCGHVAGDELLKQVALLLHGQVRESDTIARLGGDEFGILLENCPLEHAQLIAAQLLRAINDYRFCWLGKSFVIGGSIGLVAINRASASVGELLGRVDIACYAAKDLGRNRIHVFQEDDLELARRQGEMQWVSRIHWALEHDRFTLYRQDIHALGKGARPGGCEVLLRLRDEEGNLVWPGAFLPAAERYNLAPAVDRWVVGHLLQFMARQHHPDAGPPHTYFINLSGATLNDAGFDDYLRALLRDTGVPPSMLCFEITETAAIANLSRAIHFIDAIRAEGCRFALDDFGSGLSSFAYMKTLPVDFLKIDGVFVRDITRDPMDRAIVEAIHRIGHTVGLQTVAEFVEDEATRRELVSMGVDYAQGHALHRPQPLAASTTAVSDDRAQGILAGANPPG
ncbi:MAG: EAL domain-containing protein [Thiobacillaceae bacterium]